MFSDKRKTKEQDENYERLAVNSTLRIAVTRHKKHNRVYINKYNPSTDTTGRLTGSDMLLKVEDVAMLASAWRWARAVVQLHDSQGAGANFTSIPDVPDAGTVIELPPEPEPAPPVETVKQTPRARELAEAVKAKGHVAVWYTNESGDSVKGYAVDVTDNVATFTTHHRSKSGKTVPVSALAIRIG